MKLEIDLNTDRLVIEAHIHIHYPSEAPAWARRMENQMERMEKKMGKIEDKLTAIEGTMTEIGTSVLSVKGDVERNAVEIADLKTQIANGGLTPELEARFDALVTSVRSTSDALAAIDAMNPTTPDVPEPEGDAS